MSTMSETTRQNFLVGADTARTYFLATAERLGHETGMTAVRAQAVSMAANINVMGTNVMSFLEESARMQGYARMVQDLEYVKEGAGEEDIRLPNP